MDYLDSKCFLLSDDVNGDHFVSPATLLGIKEYRDEDCIALRMIGLPYSFNQEQIVSCKSPISSNLF